MWFFCNFVEKSGYEGYFAGDPTHLNGIESSHQILNVLRILEKKKLHSVHEGKGT